jgi:hypothetical protein
MTSTQSSARSSRRLPRFQSLELPRILGGFRQEPIAECHDFRQLGDGFRADDPVREGHRHCDVERTHEAAADQIPGRERGAGEGDTLAIDRCIDRHAGLIENGAAYGVDASDAGKVEPLAPALPIIDVQERESVEIGGRAQAVAAIEKLRTADRKHLLRAEPGHVQSGLGSVAVANGKIDVLAREVDVLQGRADPQIAGWVSAKRPSRWTSHFAAKFGEVLTVSAPPRWRCSNRSVPSPMRSKASRTTTR